MPFAVLLGVLAENTIGITDMHYDATVSIIY